MMKMVLPEPRYAEKGYVACLEPQMKDLMADAAMEISRGMQSLPEKVLEAVKGEGECRLYLLDFYVLPVALADRNNRKPALKESWKNQHANPQIQNYKAEYRKASVA